MDYRSALEYRIRQFTDCLKQVRARFGGRGRRHGFVIFQEDPRGEVPPRAVSPDEAGIEAHAQDRGPQTGRPRRGPAQPSCPGKSSTRYVQFAFLTHWFAMDLPKQTLEPDEAERLIRHRAGFFFLRDRPQFCSRGEDLAAFEPVRKIYLYGDEALAAEDVADVFFNVWKFPVDWQFHVYAQSFRRGQKFAGDRPLSLP